MNRVLPYLLSWAIHCLRVSCRVTLVRDPRQRLRAQGNTYIFATLHAHQAGLLMLPESRTATLLSRSKDGDLITRTLLNVGIIPVRGSGGASRKGGAAALRKLVNHVEGGDPACIAVDGPKGPRGRVRRGIAMLSQKTGQPVTPIVMVPRRRFIFKGAWDRAQVPMPFTRVMGYFGDPIFPDPAESVVEYTRRIQAALAELEREHDPDEARFNKYFRQQPEVTRKAA